jgi:branched-chain amino acid transport system ATP-binding protein
MEVLRIESLKKSFGAITVADGIDLSIGAGDAVGIIGPNGAGKTSLFNLIGGNLQPDAGRVYLLGKDVTAMGAEKRCRAGLGRTYQIPQPFAGMTVFENCLVAATSGAGKREGKSYDDCARVLEEMHLLAKANVLAGSLTLLERKALEVARALCSEPRVLLLDEIAGGLTPAEASELVETLRGVNQRGVAIVWIEHIVHALVAVVNRLVVMNFGAKVMEGAPAEVMASAEVKRIYMGMEAA